MYTNKIAGKCKEINQPTNQPTVEQTNEFIMKHKEITLPIQMYFFN